MKNNFEFHGIASPFRKNLQKSFVRESKNLNMIPFQRLTSTCWNLDQREWQYIGLDALKSYKTKMDKSFIAFNEILILKKSW